MNQNCKQELYKDVIRIKRFMGFEDYQYGINLVKEYKNFGILTEAVPFKTHALRGMAAIGDKPQPDVILLNSARTPQEQNFDCGHETIHLALHRHTGRFTFNCYSEVSPNQDPFLEWQANEGAAEFFMPHRMFIPLLHDTIGNRLTKSCIDSFVNLACDMYIVPEMAVRYRLENLKYEIYQYYAGIDLYDIKILSKKQQEKQGLFLKSLNVISDTEIFDIHDYIYEKSHSCWRRNDFSHRFSTGCSGRYNFA